MNSFKYFIIGVLLVVSVSTALAQAKITFNNTEHDFGQFNEQDGIVVAVFSFTNAGTAPLIINNVTATCGCTTPEWTREPIPPGKSGEIKVGYNPASRPGPFRKSVNVYSNTQPAITILNISGNVLQRPKTIEEEYPRAMGNLRFRANFLSLGNIPNTKTQTGELEFINSTDKIVKAAVHRAPAHLNVRFEPAEVKPGEKGKMVINYNASKVQSYGYNVDRIYISVDDIKESSMTFSVAANIEEDFSSLTAEQKANAPVASFNSLVHDFGVLRMGQTISHTFKLTNNGKSDLLIRNVKTSCGCTTTKNANVAKPGETIDFTVTFNSTGKRGRQNRSLTVITNDPNNSSIVLRMIGSVEAL